MEALHSSMEEEDRLNTYRPQMLQEVLTLAAQNTIKGRRAAGQVSLDSQAYSSWEARKLAQRAALTARAKEQEQLFQRRRQAARAAADARKEAAFSAMYQDVLDGLPHTNGITGECQAAMDYADTVRKRKQAQLYGTWSRQVFDVIQDRMQEQMECRTAADIEARLATSASAYLHATNTKLGVFRDVIIESDYDPLAPLRHTITIHTGDIVDPLKKDLLKTQTEKQLLTAGGSNRATSTGRATSASAGCTQLEHSVTRQVLGMDHWATERMKATPYGHCINRDGEYTIKPADPLALQQGRSHVVVDDYAPPPTPGKFLPGKKMVEPEVHGGRKDLFDLLSNTSTLPSGATGGDSWLEHRGRPCNLHPEGAQGRKGLGELLQHTSCPTQDGKGALGDAWLQAKGKQKVPGPEERRGRTGLFDLMQAKPLTPETKRTAGDIWLEQRGKRLFPEDL